MAISLSIHQQFGQIGLKMSPMQFELKRTPAEINIDRTPLEINSTRELGELSIDMTPMQNSLGYGNAEFFTQMAVSEARQVFESDLERTVRSGDAYAQLHKHMTIGQLAAQAKYFDNHLPEPYLEYIMPPEIHYELRDIITDVQPGQVNVNVSLGKVELLNHSPAVIESYVERAPMLEIKTEGWAFDFEV
jgi:hypothetical protein